MEREPHKADEDRDCEEELHVSRRQVKELIREKSTEKDGERQ